MPLLPNNGGCAAQVSDPLRTLAYGTDASFYRLIPKLVVQVEREDEVLPPPPHEEMLIWPTFNRVFCYDRSATTW